MHRSDRIEPASDPAAGPSLARLRDRIDHIDRQIHDLLMERSEVVEQVADAKGRPPASESGAVYMRPGREAAILRRLSDRHRGRLPVSVLLRIWREIVGGFTQMQAPFSVAAVCSGEHRALWDIARDYYGCTTPVISTDHANAALRAVMENRAAVAVLPIPEDGDPQSWWPTLMAAGGTTPNIIARLPFLDRSDGISAFAIARIPPEPTEDDRSLIAVEVDHDVSRSRLKGVFETAGWPVTAIWSMQRPGDAVSLHLIEVAGALHRHDRRLEEIAGRLGEGSARLVSIGGYATPLTVTDA